MFTQGQCESTLTPVRAAFEALLQQPGQRGAALCVQIDGQTVLDLWGGYADQHQTELWHADTLLNVFSCTKTFTAVAVLQLVAEGRLALDQSIASIWPEFAAADKGAITLRQCLAHRAGVPAVSSPQPAEALYDWQHMCQVVAQQHPWWVPGSAHGYAPITYGWLLGEVLRRVTGTEPGQAIMERTSLPLGLDFYIGLAQSEDARVAYLGRTKGVSGDAAAQRLLKVCLTEPTALSTLAFANPPSVLTSANTLAWRRFAQPAANGHGHARSLAGFYTGLLNGQLLDPALLSELTREHSVGEDRTLLTSTRFGLGCMLDQPEVANATYGLGPRSFGHPGAGGSVGCADPERGVAFGFVTNSLGPYVLMDPRAQQLAQTLKDCL